MYEPCIGSWVLHNININACQYWMNSTQVNSCLVLCPPLLYYMMGIFDTPTSTKLPIILARAEQTSIHSELSLPDASSGFLWSWGAMVMPACIKYPSWPISLNAVPNGHLHPLASIIPRPSPAPVFDHTCNMQKLPPFSNTASNQKLEPGKAWERGYIPYKGLKHGGPKLVGILVCFILSKHRLQTIFFTCYIIVLYSIVTPLL